MVADLSFISLKLVLEPIRNLLTKKYYEGIFLIKPQFEVGKEKILKGGVVKEISYHIEALESIIDFAISKKMFKALKPDIARIITSMSFVISFEKFSGIN